MEVNRTEFLNVIAALKPAVAKKDIIEQQTHLIFTGTEIAATNSRVLITYPFVSDIKASIKADYLQKLLNSSASEKMTFTIGNGKFHVKSEDTKASITTVVDEEARVEELIEILKKEMTGEWKMLPAGFSDGVWLCAFSASKKMTEGVIIAVFVQKEGIFTTDNRRASWYKLHESFDEEFLLSASDAIELSKFDVVEFLLTDNWAHFKTGSGVTFSTRILKGEQLPIRSVFDQFPDSEKIVLPVGTLKEAVDAVSFIFDKEKDADFWIDVKITKGKISCRAMQDRGVVEKFIDFASYTGPEFSFRINPLFFSQVLERSVSIQLNGTESALFTSDDFSHIILLPLSN
jgi:hypothetical protein